MNIESLESRTFLDAVPVPAGDEFRVNTGTVGRQTNPDVAADADGDFVVVWQGYEQVSAPNNVYARRYAADGTPRGPEFRVNQSVGADRHEPVVAMDEDGDFVIAWEANAAGGADVYARRYAADGTALGGEFRVNTTSAGYQREPAVAMDADGDFVVAWTGWNQSGGAESDIYARRYNAAGHPTAGEFRVNSAVAGYQNRAGVGMDPTGVAVIAWGSSGGRDATEEPHVFVRRYGPDGRSLAAPFRVNTTSNNQSFETEVGVDDAGNFAVAWGGSGPGGYSSLARLFDASGAPRGPEFAAILGYGNATQTSLSMDGSGNFVITGVARGAAAAARFYDPAGNPRGPATTLEVPGALALARKGGSFVSAITRHTRVGIDTDVYARRYAVGEVAPAARVAGRHVFYRKNGQGVPFSVLPSDDADIAPDKRPLLPGEAPSFANMISYTKGINGVMVDLAGLRPDSLVNPSDFDFGPAKPPAVVGLRRGAGVGGSDRFTFLWYDNDPTIDEDVAATVNGWLTVTAKAPNLGLGRDDVFAFGHLTGETGDAGSRLRVSALDLAAVKRSLNTPATIGSAVDFNRDGVVNALDLASVKRNLNRALPPPPALPLPPAATAPASAPLAVTPLHGPALDDDRANPLLV